MNSTSRSFGSLVAILAVSLPLLASCKQSAGFSADATPSWIPGETIESATGQCSYRLDQAWLGHEGDWKAGLTITTKNETEGNLRCAWEGLIIGPDGRALSRRVGGGGGLAPGVEQTDTVELSATYIADATSTGAWLYVGTSEGWNLTSELGWRVPNPKTARP